MSYGTDLENAVLRKVRESSATREQFFIENARRIVDCCTEMARLFGQGGRLFVMGNGGSACDAEHLAVELMHPVIEKRPALPAIALGAERALTSAIANDQDYCFIFAEQLRVLGKKGDMALALSTSGMSASVLRGLAAARDKEMMTVGLLGRDGGRAASLCDHPFVVGSFNVHRIQETHEALLHILWDVIHLVRGEEDVL